MIIICQISESEFWIQSDWYSYNIEKGQDCCGPNVDGLADDEEDLPVLD